MESKSGLAVYRKVLEGLFGEFGFSYQCYYNILDYVVSDFCVAGLASVTDVLRRWFIICLCMRAFRI